MHTCVCVYVCVYEERERISVTLVTTGPQGCASDLWMCARAKCWYYFAHLSTVSVCLPVHTVTQEHTHTHTSNTKSTYMSSNDRKSFICTEGGKHNRTPTQAHTSRYSRHLRHALENVGLHRRYALRRKIQVTSLRGAGACADERRTGVVAAEGAAAKGHCPC
jgi:hypothetical protein